MNFEFFYLISILFALLQFFTVHLQREMSLPIWMPLHATTTMTRPCVHALPFAMAFFHIAAERPPAPRNSFAILLA